MTEIEFVSLAQREAERVAAGMRADRRLYLTADKKRVVEEGDPDAAFLLCGVGTELLPRQMEALGLSHEGGKVRIKTQPKMADKAMPAPAEKAIDDYTVVELKEIAKQNELAGYSTMNKAELWEALTEAGYVG